MQLHICHLYPDVLNLYGDRGNIAVMRQRLMLRGVQAEVTECPIGAALDASAFDLIFIGGGQDFEQQVLLRDLAGGKAAALRQAVEGGVTILAICGGYQMLGQYYQTHTGEQMEFIGALNLYTVGAKKRMIGNYLYQTEAEDGGSLVVGFENHSGKTYLGAGVRPLGTVLSGKGNNGRDKTEGARYKNVFATYAHGPLLPKNPVLCDRILQTALEHRYQDKAGQLAALDDRLELAAHDAMVRRLR